MAKPWTTKPAANIARSHPQESSAAAIAAFETARAVLPCLDPCVAAYTTEGPPASHQRGAHADEWQDLIDWHRLEHSQQSLGFRPALGYRTARIYGYKHPRLLTS